MHASVVTVGWHKEGRREAEANIPTANAADEAPQRRPAPLPLPRCQRCKWCARTDRTGRAYGGSVMVASYGPLWEGGQARQGWSKRASWAHRRSDGQGAAAGTAVAPRVKSNAKSACNVTLVIVDHAAVLSSNTKHGSLLPGTARVEVRASQPRDRALSQPVGSADRAKPPVQDVGDTPCCQEHTLGCQYHLQPAASASQQHPRQTPEASRFYWAPSASVADWDRSLRRVPPCTMGTPWGCFCEGFCESKCALCEALCDPSPAHEKVRPRAT